MTHLVYYKYERDLFPETSKYFKAITPVEALGLTCLVCNRFNLPLPKLDIRKLKCSKFVFYKNPANDTQKNYREIVYHKNYLIVGDVSHETGHYLQFHKLGTTRHDRKLARVVIGIQKYLDTIIT